MSRAGRWIIAGWAAAVLMLAAGSAVTLTMCAHHRPLHHVYRCEFAKDFRQEVHLPPAPCDTP
jgi:hypothetical protein